MKKYLSLIVMIFAIGCLCACGSVSSNEVSIYDTSTGKTISVGDTKEEVDEALGTPKEEMNYSEYEDNLHITYLNKKVEYMSVDVQHTKSCPSNDVNHSRYQLKKGNITAESTLNEFKQIYKQSISDNIQNQTEIYEKKPNGRYKKLDISTVDEIYDYPDTNNIYGVAVGVPFDCGDEDKIISIEVGQIDRLMYGASFGNELSDNQKNWKTGYESLSDEELQSTKKKLEQLEEQEKYISNIADKSNNTAESIKSIDRQLANSKDMDNVELEIKKRESNK